MLHSLLFVSFFLLTTRVLSGTFTLSDNYQGEDFLNEWDFEAIPDPTNGYV
jgi:hypothetical protein